jgi:Txe/YoeB family toxin of toxin-antitoxin system
VSWAIVYTRQACKDAKRIAHAGLRDKVEALTAILSANPFRSPPPYESLVGDLKGLYSRRINIAHRLVYEVLKERKTVKVLRLWTHYGE